MKLNYECVNAIMKYLEENLKIIVIKSGKNPEYSLSTVMFNKLVEDFSELYPDGSDVFYCIDYLEKCGYIILSGDGANNIKDITPKGHHYLRELNDNSSEQVGEC